MSDLEKEEARINKKLYLRGCASNSFGALILYLIASQLNLGYYVVIATGIQIAVFLFHGLPYKSERFYDISGSATHFALVAASLIRETRIRSSRQILMALASTVWMTRLGTFLYVRISKDGKDDRFDALKKNWLSFMGAWTIQALWVVLIQLPVILMNDTEDTSPITLIDGLAAFMWVSGFLIEFIADVEKFTFRTIASNKDKFISTGIWSVSRHPNYFGEILMWFSMAMSCSFTMVLNGQIGNAIASWFSPLFTALLLLKVSGVPMVEKAGEKKWGKDPAYMKYMAETPCIIPSSLNFKQTKSA
mmetsp:Transcript_35356/g.41673  ORF Transcript_35356/g.41673 Transcript_35356/m.41673 type:complete len:305 (-) Transcript_35356:26-940(-)|eukprot:CAMPEP_0114360204 /NCGR_PEP_ID=MMETSP0101-20121206/23653_1 /TAXON_ID=38822 ORGANISM="Pteridomonas danica, Strain PT" /NCGR_SAMPLE_ID=MMETSP0101 /ASSEMBLY_ACC=CAM_ASM_000211 /LENGTH=304 /DNA_ID=CAMNT_0001504253 /DNA_START=277 /DNA_END=1191 /DNA_ORIENTATION=+